MSYTGRLHSLVIQGGFYTLFIYRIIQYYKCQNANISKYSSLLLSGLFIYLPFLFTENEYLDNDYTNNDLQLIVRK